MEMEACSSGEGASPFNSCVSVGCEQKSTSQCPSTTARDSSSSSRRQNKKNHRAAQWETANKEMEPSVGDLSEAKFHHLYDGHSLLQRGTLEPLSISDLESPRSSAFHHKQPKKRAQEMSHIENLEKLNCLEHQKDYRRRKDPSPDVMSIGNIRDLENDFDSYCSIHRDERQRNNSFTESHEIVNADIQNYSYSSLVPINTHNTETPRDKAAKQYTTLKMLRRQLDYDFEKSMSQSQTRPKNRNREMMDVVEKSKSVFGEGSRSLMGGDFSDVTNSSACQCDSSRQNDDRAPDRDLSLDGMSLKNLRERMNKIDLEHRISMQRGKVEKHIDGVATQVIR